MKAIEVSPLINKLARQKASQTDVSNLQQLASAGWTRAVLVGTDALAEAEVVIYVSRKRDQFNYDCNLLPVCFSGSAIKSVLEAKQSARLEQFEIEQAAVSLLDAFEQINSLAISDLDAETASKLAAQITDFPLSNRDDEELNVNEWMKIAREGNLKGHQTGTFQRIHMCTHIGLAKCGDQWRVVSAKLTRVDEENPGTLVDMVEVWEDVINRTRADIEAINPILITDIQPHRRNPKELN